MSPALICGNYLAIPVWRKILQALLLTNIFRLFIMHCKFSDVTAASFPHHIRTRLKNSQGKLESIPIEIIIDRGL
ncbi:MAG: hypothetical protein DRI57_22130 [Deltaproteobacteria bacterium]|nr:MAG: hypothetical protein DRI57_22130 [Deltaproteobacteria bacterium]